jgi:hypothetical protein
MTSPYWIKAQATHNFTVGNILSPFDSYKEKPGAGRSDTWHNASQIWADSLIVSLGDDRYHARSSRQRQCFAALRVFKTQQS